MNPWWIVGGVLVLWWLGWLYHTYPRGRHRLEHSDTCPVGQVWWHDGTWWTFCRRQWGRVPRCFENRSNPLDHEEYVAETWQECRERRRYAEVEY